jgi:hypothetical protein
VINAGDSGDQCSRHSRAYTAAGTFLSHGEDSVSLNAVTWSASQAPPRRLRHLSRHALRSSKRRPLVKKHSYACKAVLRSRGAECFQWNLHE